MIVYRIVAMTDTDVRYELCDIYGDVDDCQIIFCYVMEEYQNEEKVLEMNVKKKGFKSNIVVFVPFVID